MIKIHSQARHCDVGREGGLLLIIAFAPSVSP